MTEIVLDDFKDFMTKYDVSKSELAKHLGITPQYLYHFENGREIPQKIVTKFYQIEKEYQKRYEFDCLIDWLHIQFNVPSAEYVIEKVLGMDIVWFQTEFTNRYNYGKKYFLDRLIILECKEDRQDMGCLFSLTGKGCRLFEKYLQQRDFTWFDFLRHAVNLGGKVTRIDLAIDDYAEYVSINDILTKIEKREFKSRFRKIEPRYTLEYNEEEDTYERVGITVYFGSRQSQLQLCLYQKNYELAKKLNKDISDIAVKNRYELRFRDKLGQSIVEELLKQEDLANVTLGVLFQRVILLESDKQTVWKAWEKLARGITKITLKMIVKVASYEQQLDYLSKGYARSIKTLLAIDKANGWNNVERILNDTTLNNRYNDIIKVMSDKDTPLIETSVGG